MTEEIGWLFCEIHLAQYQANARCAHCVHLERVTEMAAREAAQQQPVLYPTIALAITPTLRRHIEGQVKDSRSALTYHLEKIEEELDVINRLNGWLKEIP